MIVEAARLMSRRYGLACTTYSDDWVIVLEKDGRRLVICGYAFGLNTDAASACANDKVATYHLLAAMRLPVVPHYLLSTIVTERVDRQLLGRLLEEHTSLVVKPLRGSRGDMVARFNNARGIVSFMRRNGEREWTASPFIDIQSETRVVVFDGIIHLVYEKINPVVVGNLKMFNLSKGTEARNVELSEVPQKLKNLATQAMDALNLRIGAVDIVLDSSGTARVIEINSHFSLDHFAESSEANKTLVVQFYEFIIGKTFGLD